MRFGIQTGQQNVSFEEMRACWQVADEAGFDIAYVFDHFIPIFSDENGPCLECFTALTALACSTQRIRVSTMVVGNSYRHPALLANICASLDVISNGRFELGIGAGWFQREYDAYGYDFPAIGTRLRMMEEAIHVVRALCTEQAPSFKGRYYALTDARMEPKPVQKPCFPIFIGGRGEQLTLRAVARAADGWNIIATTPEEFAKKSAVLREHCEREGRDPSGILKSAAVRFAGFGGSPAADGSLAGSVEQVRETVGRFQEAGAGEVTLTMRAPYPLEAVRQFMAEVAPSFR